MFSSTWRVVCLRLILLFVALPPAVRAQPSPQAAPTIVINGLGHGAVPLDGPWQFHIGDDPAWADPGFDDSHWEQISAARPWGDQSHFAYAGFAWYRLHLRITPAAGVNPQLSLLMPVVMDAYEVYWNGRLIGALGTLPPHPSWPAFSNSHIFGFPADTTGTLAVRVWSAPLGSDASGKSGGFAFSPQIGDRDSIAALQASSDFDRLRSGLYLYGLTFLRTIIGGVAFILWLRRRSDQVLLWFAIFTAAPEIWNLLYCFDAPMDTLILNALNQPLWAVRNISLWFLLIFLLRLESHHAIIRWAKVLAILKLTGDTLDGLIGLVYFAVGWGSHPWIQWVDAVLTGFTTILGVFPLVVVALGMRRRLDRVRWAVALAAFLSQWNIVVVSAAQQGQRFTHWTLGATLGGPIFSWKGMYFNAQILADTALFYSIVYAVVRLSSESRRRQLTLEQEFRNARELQQVLIPESLPEIPGFTLTSAYKPALEVGGDFFQIVPLDGGLSGSTLIVLGDVSGKGLKAAMAVSLLVGAIRTAAEITSSPAEILASLNRRLEGRLNGGFATCVALRLDPGGRCTLASAGHPAPFLNDQEIALAGALPLGLAPATAYEEVHLQLTPADHLALYTDGLLEARSPSGELYSFARMKTLFAARPTAAQATQAAVAFGQDDDITVLTLTRLAPGHISAPLPA